ncbi:UNVERIFIED_CONTAM: hypothetical protein FKN15_030181 [Acipenser sinensis]
MGRREGRKGEREREERGRVERAGKREGEEMGRREGRKGEREREERGRVERAGKREGEEMGRWQGGEMEKRWGVGWGCRER